MRIQEVNTHVVESDAPIEEYGVGGWLIVEITTDEGITGYGESGAWAFLKTSEAAIERFRSYLEGKDPLKRDHHLQYMYRSSHFRGAAIMSAISAIDIALWDIAGKHFDAPIYELLGGKSRDKLRTYAHIIGETTVDLVTRCEKARDEGFSAVGHLSPLLDEPRSKPYSTTYASMIEGATERVRQFREAVGNDVDLCIEIHRRLDPQEAITLANEIEQFSPFFIEDPIRPDNFDAMGKVADNISVPIATGERLNTIEEFSMLLNRKAVDYVRPDICLAGGLTSGKKIAAIAESQYVDVIPHNPLGPISTAACVQLAAAIPNFALQEFPYRPEKKRLQGETIMDDGFEWEDGYVIVPDGPGLGIDINLSEIENRPHQQLPILTRLHEDGSVIDQ